jgi:hypothetical protein
MLCIDCIYYFHQEGSTAEKNFDRCTAYRSDSPVTGEKIIERRYCATENRDFTCRVGEKKLQEEVTPSPAKAGILYRLKSYFSKEEA